jgi:hypothetical protein
MTANAVNLTGPTEGFDIDRALNNCLGSEGRLVFVITRGLLQTSKDMMQQTGTERRLRLPFSMQCCCTASLVQSNLPNFKP